MNLLTHFSSLGINTKHLTKKKQQTTKKIEYVKEYVEKWAIISAERQDIQAIHFIDCMCNAGVYEDGDCCTATEVINIFQRLSRKYPGKAFFVYCNDNDAKRISILQKILPLVMPQKPCNLNVFVSKEDVNHYLELLNQDRAIAGTPVFGYGNSTVLFVDPFDFGTVEIPKISKILQNNYCELIFNFFISDYVRNIERDTGRIANCLGGNRVSSKDELVYYVQSQLRVGYIKYSFAYQFKILNNVELYQIIFATPNIRGLEVLKDVLWDVFKGSEFHRNAIETGQMTLISDDDDKKFLLNKYAEEAKIMLSNYFTGKTVSFNEIDEFLMESTMLKESQIIENIIKPMLSVGTIAKQGLVRKNNYKGDKYYIR